MYIDYEKNRIVSTPFSDCTNGETTSTGNDVLIDCVTKPIESNAVMKWAAKRNKYLV